MLAANVETTQQIKAWGHSVRITILSILQETMENTEATTKCDNCKNIDSSLKRCAKCKSAAYCDRDCQKAHWKQHKKDCGRLAGGKNSNGQSEETQPRRSDAKPFTAIYHGNFLHDRSEEETFKILIDMLRMRQEDTYALEGMADRYLPCCGR